MRHLSRNKIKIHPNYKGGIKKYRFLLEDINKICYNFFKEREKIMNKKIITLLTVIGVILIIGITGIIAAPHVPYKVSKSETDSLNSSFYKFTMSEITGDIHKLIEDFYVNFNNDKYLYVCNNLLPQSAMAEISQQKCLEDLESLHKIFGSNVSYDLNSAKIIKEKNTYKKAVRY